MLITLPPVRELDVHGQGYYGAPRGTDSKGKPRYHRGIDYACWPETLIVSFTGGLARVGYPYANNPDHPKNDLRRQCRLVSVKEGNDEIYYMYVDPMVSTGDLIEEGQPIGRVQDLREIYDGITPHIHFGVKRNGRWINPQLLFDEWREA